VRESDKLGDNPYALEGRACCKDKRSKKKCYQGRLRQEPQTIKRGFMDAVGKKGNGRLQLYGRQENLS
jgi:hypothetical protein